MNMLSVVKYFPKKLHLRCLTRFWIHYFNIMSIRHACYSTTCCWVSFSPKLRYFSGKSNQCSMKYAYPRSGTRDLKSGNHFMGRPGNRDLGSLKWDRGPRSKNLIIHWIQDPRHETLKMGPETPMVDETRDAKQSFLVELWIQELWSKWTESHAVEIRSK